MNENGASKHLLTPADGRALIAAMEGAENLILATIQRQCEALRTGRLLAAQALHTRLKDTARLYLNAAKAARASLAVVDDVQPEFAAAMDDGRKVFAALLRIELSVLAAERAAATPDRALDGMATAASPADLRPVADAPRRTAPPRFRGSSSGKAATPHSRAARSVRTS